LIAIVGVEEVFVTLEVQIQIKNRVGGGGEIPNDKSREGIR